MRTESILNKLTEAIKMNNDNISEVQESVELLKTKKMEGTAKILELLIKEDKKLSEFLETLKTEILMNIDE